MKCENDFVLPCRRTATRVHRGIVKEPTNLTVQRSHGGSGGRRKARRGEVTDHPLGRLDPLTIANVIEWGPRRLCNDPPAARMNETQREQIKTSSSCRCRLVVVGTLRRRSVCVCVLLYFYRPKQPAIFRHFHSRFVVPGTRQQHFSKRQIKGTYGREVGPASFFAHSQINKTKICRQD